MPKENTHFFSPLDDQIEEALLQHRRIFLSDAVDTESAQAIIRKLWFLEWQEPGKPILFVINSPGGSTDAGFAIWDQIQMISSPISTLITGMAASMGSVLSLTAKKGRRFITPFSRVMIHQPLISGVIQGQATDLSIHAKEILKTKESIVDIYVKATGKPREEISKAIDRDTWLTAEEAKTFGLVDTIVSNYSQIPLT